MTSYQNSCLAAEVQVTNAEVERVRRALEKEFVMKALERLMVEIEFWLPDSVTERKLDIDVKATIVAKLLKLLRRGPLKQYSDDPIKCFFEGKAYLRSAAGVAWMENRFLPKDTPKPVRSQSKRSKVAKPTAPTPTKLAIAPSPAETRQDATLPSVTSPILPSAISPTPVHGSKTAPCVVGVEAERGGQRIVLEESGLCVQCWTIHPKNRGGPFISLATPATVVDEVTQQRLKGLSWRRRIATSAFVVTSASVAVIAWYLHDVSQQPRKN